MNTNPVSAIDQATAADRDGRKPAAAAVPLASDGSTPPLTNRGCVVPSREVFFHLDYLKLTVFSGIESVMDMVESGLQEPAGLEMGGWIEKGPAERWEHILIGAGPITLLAPKDQRITYSMVEMKGEACSIIGGVGLASFLGYLSRREVRWHSVRVDLAFDHVAFGPDTFHKAVEAGNFNSRCFCMADRDWNENVEGRTAYLGRRNHKKDRRVRIYDKRGYNRLEGEFRGAWSKSLGRKLAETALVEWPSLAIGYMRGMVDFIDRAADARPDRCPLLPWWAEFVGNVERIKNLPEEDRQKTADDSKRHVIGITEGRIQRCAKSLWPILQAFGPEYLAKRVEHFMRDKTTDEMRAFAETLKKYQYCGLGGLDGDPNEEVIPF